MKKKWIVILLALCMCLGCSTSKKSKVNEEEILQKGASYIEKMKNFEVREKDPDKKTNNADFEEFLDKVFIETMESDFLTMRFSVIDYKSFGIEKPPVDIGEISYGFDEENFQYMEDQLNELLAFDYDSLSYRQQYDYEALEYSLYETLASMCYYPYNYIFATGSNLAENIISNFTDYTFYDQESLDDYLTCLEDFDRYFADCLQYTKDQYDDGHPMLQAWVDYTVEVCEDVLNKTEDNEFIVSFDRRMEDVSFLSAAEKAEYSEKNKKIVLEEVLPAYENLKSEITSYAGKGSAEDYVLSKMNKDYAELTYMLMGSTNESLTEVFQDLKDNFSQLEANFITCYYSAISYDKYAAAYDGDGNLSLVGKECLEYLRQNLKTYYPDLGEVDYNIEELDPDTAPSTVVAYYWPSPIDDTNQNKIRTNPNNMVEGFETYGTLAHEGFPGHLYQNVYYYRTNPHNFRSVISFIGYTEGWAVDAQLYAYQFSGIDDEYAADAIFFEDAYYFILYSIIDMGVNYFGWSSRDIVNYFKDESRIFEFDTATANEIREFLIEMPGVYCSYGIGSSEFMTLTREAKNLLKDKFDYVSFHEAMLKNGPLPFQILRGALKEYTSAN